MGLSLQIGSLDRLSPNDQQRQIVELFNKLENYLNAQVTVYVRNDAKKPYPHFKQGDILFDLLGAPQSLQIFEYNGKKLVPLTVASLVGGVTFDDITGQLNIISRGSGSGTDNSLYLKSNGAGGWELATPNQLIANFTAAVALAAYDPVTNSGQLADSTNLAHKGRVIGIVKAATAIGNVGQAVIEGTIIDAGWSLAPNTKLFLNGTTISATAPTTGFSQLLAIARTDMEVLVQPKHAIQL